MTDLAIARIISRCLDTINSSWTYGEILQMLEQVITRHEDKLALVGQLNELKRIYRRSQGMLSRAFEAEVNSRCRAITNLMVKGHLNNHGIFK